MNSTIHGDVAETASLEQEPSSSTVVQQAESIQEHEAASVVSDPQCPGEEAGTATLATDMKSLFEEACVLHSDVTLRVGTEQFSAHKAILASRSKVFRAMFESGMKECQENTLDLVEMKPSTARNMLQFIYSGSLGEISVEEALDVYAASDKYNLQELKSWGKELILRNMSSDHVCDVTVLADLHSDEDLAMASCRALKNNLQVVLNTEKWRDFAKQNATLYSELLEKVLLM
ncbi:speckle-type POZ protein-like [Uloborus diversus]|uniref:speckle-type POZ protein-like n=1 Tax=Uloborus diversus TaxID=327109 RepID=UPI00240A80EC|nr:speckle-type POZ protein-like [Uloborus diversus]